MTRDEAKKAIAEYCGATINKLYKDKSYCNLEGFIFSLSLIGSEGRANKKTGFYYYSTASLRNDKAVMGLWLQDKLRNSGFSKEELQVRKQIKKKEGKEGEEGHVADFYLDIDWEKLSDKDLTQIKNLYDRLKKFQENNEAWPNDENERKSQIKLYNEGHLSDVRTYIAQRLKGGVSKEEQPQDSKKQTIMPPIQSLLKANLNVIYFGAPGTGKSFKLKEAVEGKKNNDGSIFQDKDNRIGLFVDVKDGKVNQRRYERVTFYPTYSYAQFVGCYKPVMKPKSDGTPGDEIAYEFVAGPFLRVLVKALNDRANIFCLVIEEINRANAAAVFGDVFQLLDRPDGVSDYDIAVSEDVKKFLYEDKNGLTEDGKETLEKLAGEGRLKIPSNMYIWATMNSADQGVFPLDTAFKRRWEFEYIGIDNGEDSGGDGQLPPNKWTIAGGKHKYNWNDVRKYINDLLSENGVNEDKLMGVRFVTATDAAKDGEPLSLVSPATFKSKVLMYLWEDAARMCRQKLFANGIKTFSKLQDEWDDKGVDIFFRKDGQDAMLPKDLTPSKPDEESNDEGEKTGIEG